MDDRKTALQVLMKIYGISWFLLIPLYVITIPWFMSQISNLIPPYDHIHMYNSNIVGLQDMVGDFIAPSEPRLRADLFGAIAFVILILISSKALWALSPGKNERLRPVYYANYVFSFIALLSVVSPSLVPFLISMIIAKVKFSDLTNDEILVVANDFWRKLTDSMWQSDTIELFITHFALILFCALTFQLIIAILTHLTDAGDTNGDGRDH